MGDGTATVSADVQVLESLFNKQKLKSQAMRLENISERRKRLKVLEEAVRKFQPRLEEAVFADLGKPAMEVSTSEVFPALAEIQQALDNLSEWSKPKKIDAPITFLGTRSVVVHEPKGVCLIISPWNYPFNLSICPLASCLAAGNTAILKPSEMTPKTSALIAEMIRSIFDEDTVAVVEGDAETSTELLKLPFDHIFFTGSPNIGKVVMKAAAENLTSVTLELGGKSPAIVDATADLKDAAKRIAFGKFLNNGQTCVAPDYILVHSSVHDKFLNYLKESVNEVFGKGSAVNKASDDYARIVNSRHFGRLNNLLRDAIEKGATPSMTGDLDAETKFFPPTILTNVNDSMLVMHEEIFGPVLPIVPYESADSAIATINAKPKPLSLYIFSYDRAYRKKVLAATSAGGVCINDCVIQFTHPLLPFGGVNNSGIGKSHGHAGFLSFTNEKPVVIQKRGYSNAYLFYPPYTKTKRRLVDIVLDWFL